MWNELLKENRDEYRKMILAFASLTRMFAQKEENGDPAPIINSKFQETVFQRSFNANAEDIGNTSYDASINHPSTQKKYLIGIKTFGIYSGSQKIAQFKTNHDEWSDLINRIKTNSENPDGLYRTKEEVDSVNRELYMELARNISILRNKRIDSSISNIRGFRIEEGEEFESVYHVLMPSKKGDTPAIFVGETNLDHIAIDEIQILGCTRADKPTNFTFTDGKHVYRYTSADSQLLMDFNNRDIVVEEWEVKYADDAYSFFENISKEIHAKSEPKEEVSESYCWKLVVEPFSGFNSFYGIGTKLSKDKRDQAVEKLYDTYRDSGIPKIERICENIRKYLVEPSESPESKENKVKLRNEIINELNNIDNPDFKKDVTKLLFRPKNEMYIRIPESRKFHTEHPDFFGPGIGNLANRKKMDSSKEERKFTLVFEPSGERMESYITQEFGKAIESYKKQTYLGEWILRKVFQLEEFEPLTMKRLDELEINGMRLYKFKGSNDIHFQFVWIDDENPPDDYVEVS